MSLVHWIFELAVAILILVCEGLLHFLWKVFPSRTLQALFLRKKDAKEREMNPDLERDFVELVKARDYKVEEHYVTTSDGYILGVHRILPKHYAKPHAETRGHQTYVSYNAGVGLSSSSSSENAAAPAVSVGFKGVVFFQHGFMQNSEAWVVRGPDRALPYILVDAGYDVWLGNNRGNKYSYKHAHLAVTEERFWDFCLDDLASKDIPAMIDYVLHMTGASSLSYVGFSQGTAQAFAAFSSNPALNHKVNLFVALAPAARVQELKNPVVSAVSQSKPELLYILFGRKMLLHQAMFWRKMLHTRFFVWTIDFFLKFLFGWKTHNIDPSEKALLYNHLYSFSSVKTLVHWFQITHSRRFQMYDDNIKVNSHHAYHTYLLPTYTLDKITCPIAIFYGDVDTIPDMRAILSDLPPSVLIHKEESYEHLDFMWAKSAPERVFPKVVALIDQFSKGTTISPTAMHRAQGRAW